MINLLQVIFLCMMWSTFFGQDSIRDRLHHALDSSVNKDRVVILLSLAQHESISDPVAALEYVQQALSLARELEDPLLLANALNGTAIIYYYLGDQNQSLKYLLQSIDQMKIARLQDTANLELLFRIAIFSSNAGNVYKGLGQLDHALGAFLQSEDYLTGLMKKDQKNPRYLSTYIVCLNNKALVYRDLGETGKAESNLNQALKLSRERDYPEGIAMCLNNLGLIEIERKSYIAARDVYTEALQINQRLRDSIAIAGTYNNLGLIYESTGSFGNALEYYKSSLLISERLRYLFGVSNTSINIGKIYTELRQFDRAKTYLEQGLTTAKQGDILHLQQQCYQQLSEMYRISGQYHKALYAYQDYSTIKDSVFNIERSKQIAEMETKYETEKKVQENEALRKDIALRKTTQRLLFVAVSGLVVVVILLFIVIRYKTRFLKQKTILFNHEQRMQRLELEKKEIERKHFEDQVFAEQEINRLQQNKLEQQNRKLATSALQITAKNQILLAILHETERIKRSGDQDAQTFFRSVKQIVSSNLNLDKDWEHFKRHFEEVHPDFFVRLNNRYPDLTSGEQKICAYHRINLGTHEIAQILNITKAGVQKSRHRIRKKMGLDSETDMAEFMLRF